LKKKERNDRKRLKFKEREEQTQFLHHNREDHHERRTRKDQSIRDGKEAD
jgi:hypothetical protein